MTNRTMGVLQRKLKTTNNKIIDILSGKSLGCINYKLRLHNVPTPFKLIHSQNISPEQEQGKK